MKKKDRFDFDFFAEPESTDLPEPSASTVSPPEPVPPTLPQSSPRTVPVFTRQKMRLAVMSWLLEHHPGGIATAVPTRFRKFQADIAAFWTISGRKHPRPGKTVLIEIRLDRSQCWPDCSGKEELLGSMRELKIKKENLEASIRDTEPHLRDADTLFDEFQNWNYLGTTNPEYQHCLKQIEKAEHALYRGSRFEQIRRALLAEYTYLAVPENTVTPEEIAYGWGLLYVTPALEVKVIKEPNRWECPAENKLHLVHNIASAALKDVLFANGVNLLQDGRRMLTMPPRRRRKSAGTHEEIV